jgi:hypothetical protein
MCAAIELMCAAIEALETKSANVASLPRSLIFQWYSVRRKTLDFHQIIEASSDTSLVMKAVAGV